MPEELGLDDFSGLDAPGADIATDDRAFLNDFDFLKIGGKFTPADTGSVQADSSAGFRQTMTRDNIAGMQSLSADMTCPWHFLLLCFNPDLFNCFA